MDKAEEFPKVAIVTGASQGIGAGLVEAYRRLGYAVVAASRTIASSDEADLLTVQGDVADRKAAERVVAAALDRYGRIDTLVNNAGRFIGKPFSNYTEDDYEVVTAVNIGGFFHITQLSVPHMIAQGGGHIVQVTTSLVDHAQSAAPALLASLTKGGLQAATKGLAIEYAAQGIRANAVSLGVIDTFPNVDADREALARLHPLGRMGEIRDVVDAVMFLENAPFVTGEILHVDGGQSAGH
ncbi:SDR family NAD(P)-dependent oxidoreductase [Streptacidiphilus neutrinimicus]|uniref:SDR family NAD(P)-dependent oxidoreductase n=1 Tax=Streptacidiphilus neutrinimicus TaxID=105420 RepID=UPI0005A61765|nr:SDR family oxidoreductase [Streptacidiphilus neutrinimicus]